MAMYYLWKDLKLSNDEKNRLSFYITDYREVRQSDKKIQIDGYGYLDVVLVFSSRIKNDLLGFVQNPEKMPYVIPTDKQFADSPDAGTKECLCSRCGNMIEEHEVPIRIWDTDDKGEIHPDSKEYRFCQKCFDQ